MHAKLLNALVSGKFIKWYKKTHTNVRNMHLLFTYTSTQAHAQEHKHKCTSTNPQAHKHTHLYHRGPTVGIESGKHIQNIDTETICFHVRIAFEVSWSWIESKYLREKKKKKHHLKGVQQQYPFCISFMRKRLLTLPLWSGCHKEWRDVISNGKQIDA